jgi:hypothetical protein
VLLLADVASAGSPAVEGAVEDSVRAFFERFPVVRAGDRRAGPFVSGDVDGLSDDSSELLPADGCSLPSVSSWSGSAVAGQASGLSVSDQAPVTPAMDGPSWRVIFGISCPSSTWTVDRQCGQHGAPTE